MHFSVVFDVLFLNLEHIPLVQEFPKQSPLFILNIIFDQVTAEQAIGVDVIALRAVFKPHCIIVSIQQKICSGGPIWFWKHT